MGVLGKRKADGWHQMGVKKLENSYKRTAYLLKPSMFQLWSDSQEAEEV